jgi:hypothetical protein
MELDFLVNCCNDFHHGGGPQQSNFLHKQRILFYDAANKLFGMCRFSN